MYYLIITTDFGTLDMSGLKVFYRTKKEAEKMAKLARSIEWTETVRIEKTGNHKARGN